MKHFDCISDMQKDTQFSKKVMDPPTKLEREAFIRNVSGGEVLSAFLTLTEYSKSQLDDLTEQHVSNTTI